MGTQVNILLQNLQCYCRRPLDISAEREQNVTDLINVLMMDSLNHLNLLPTVTGSGHQDLLPGEEHQRFRGRSPDAKDQRPAAS